MIKIKDHKINFNLKKKNVHQQNCKSKKPGLPLELTIGSLILQNLIS